MFLVTLGCSRPAPTDDGWSEKDAEPVKAQVGGDSAVVPERDGDVDAAPTADAAPPPVDAAPQGTPSDLPPERRVLMVKDGQELIVDVDQAIADGYTIVDLSNDWVPFIFQPGLDKEGRLLHNRYRQVFIGLANDKTDGDGRALPKDEVNYLEVFGVPPSIGVIRERFISDARSDCLASLDYELLAGVDALGTGKDKSRRKKATEARQVRQVLEAARKEALVGTYEELVKLRPETQEMVNRYRALTSDDRALEIIEKRLTCEGHLVPRYGHKPGQHDQGLQLGIRRFQREHMIYEHQRLRGETMDLLAKPPNELNYGSLRRALRERVVAATSIVEDGSANVGEEGAQFRGSDGELHPVPNLVDDFTQVAMEQLGLETPEKALAFFERHPADDFTWLKGAVKFPPLPEYYGPDMDLSIVVDRGDVWYEPPFGPNGKLVGQPRQRMPKLYLYTEYRGQKILLVRHGTTIGGWREDQAPNGYVYYRYKGSDVGPRVIRNIIAGPTWVAPESTPGKGLAKTSLVNGKRQGTVNYNELGPGYLSAYGLVAGYFVTPGSEQDNGIRAHGSSEYMSIISDKYSHGCHRLMNHKAVRMYGFILNHRAHRVRGEQRINHQRQFLHNEAVYEVRLVSRGFLFRLEKALPVNVLEGRVRGSQLTPIEGYVEIPGHEYPATIPTVGGDSDKTGGVEEPAEGEE